ncbi:MAG: segregation/condensation protein A, partial [Aestuariivirga sp.]|nr:segregation/condensation protein A [Aestuariivirga sp.]
MSGQQDPSSDGTVTTGPWPDGEAPLRAPAAAADATDQGMLIVELGGFEGPLDLLLELARHHKVDLKQISILKLAEQYL